MKCIISKLYIYVYIYIYILQDNPYAYFINIYQINVAHYLIIIINLILYYQ